MTFRGIEFRHTDWTLPAEGIADAQAATQAPTLFEATGAEEASARAALLPVRDAVHRQAQRLVRGSGDRVVEPDALDETTVAAIPGIGDDHVVEGALLGAAAR